MQCNPITGLMNKHYLIRERQTKLCPDHDFWYFSRFRSCKIQVNLQYPSKFTKTRNISVKLGKNLIKCMSGQHIWNLFQLLGLVTCCKLANLSWNFVSETCKLCPETTWRRLCCKKLSTSHDVKGFAIGSFLEH